MKKVLFFIGNGFNYYLKSKFKEHDLLTEDEIEQVDRIINLWDKFDDYFTEVKKYFLKIDSGLTDEEILEQIYESLNLLYLLNQSKIIQNKTCNDCIDNTKESIQKNIFQMLNNIVIEYIDNLAVTYKIDELMEKNSQIKILDQIDFSVVTTNYDNLVDEFFRIRKYKLEDGFLTRTCNSSNYESLDFVCFDDDNFSINNKIIHLHGSFMFFEKKNKSIKFKRNSINNEVYTEFTKKGYYPNIVFNVPSLKEKIISQSYILSTYLKKIEKIQGDETLIFIAGLSLKSDPHLKKILIDILEKRFSNNQDLLLVIYDKNPEDVANEIFSVCTIKNESDKKDFELKLKEKLFYSSKIGMLKSLEESLES